MACNICFFASCSLFLVMLEEVGRRRRKRRKRRDV